MHSDDEPLDTLEAAKAAEPPPKAWPQLLPWLALLVLLVIGGPIATYYITDAKGEAAASRAAASNSARDAERLEQQVKDLGAKPVVTPTAVPSGGPTGAEKNLTAEEVRSVVTDELSRYKVTITQTEVTQIARVAASMVPRPVDGKTPTAAQLRPLVTIAVATYCTNDRCVGKAGTNGTNGDDGTNGIDGRDGKDAPKVTDDQLRPLIAESFANYCGQESAPCRGAVGPTGPTGAKGDDGVGIADTDCVGEGAESYWRIHYTNGNEGRSQGPCRISMPPETTPAKKKTGN